MSETPGIRRRHLLAAAGAVGATAALGGISLSSPAHAADAATADPFDTLRTRAADQLTGGAIDPTDPDYAPAIKTLSTQAATWAAAMDTATGRSTLWSDLPLTSSDPSNFGNSLARLETLAIAWSTPGTAQHGDARFSAQLVSALQLVHDLAYNADSPQETGNWWYWEIGGARRLLTTCTLLYDQLPPDQLAAHLATIDRWCPNADQRLITPGVLETGANRADKALNVALRGILGKDSAKLTTALDGLSDTSGGGTNSLFQYVSSGDGYYTDGSFVQHSHIAYTGTYGTILLGDLATLLALLQGTDWAVTDPGVSVVLDSVERAYTPFTQNGLMMDTVRGRAVSRQAETDATDGQAVITAVLLLAAGAPEPYATRFRQLVKGWIDRGGGTSAYYSSPTVGIPAIARAKSLYADTALAPAAQTVGSYVLADMDRVVHRRPGWSFAISMSSHRIAPVEWGNGENQHGWYQGDGMAYLYTDSDPAQFNDAFWPTVDPYRMPGTTVDTRPRANLLSGGFTYYLSPETWVGGAVLDNRWTAAGMSIAPQDVTLRGRKSWFLLDDAVLALGAGITSTDGRTIETVVENRNLHDGGARFTTGGPQAAPGSWAHLDGTGGYAFPDGTPYRWKRERRTGTWNAIDNGPGTGGDTTPQTREYLTLWIDHGTSPSDAAYAYALLPGASADATAQWAAARPVRILTNTASAQAVGVDALSLTAANFWQPGEVDGLSCDSPAAVLLRLDHGRLHIAVADPSRTATTLHLQIPYPAASVISADPTVTLTPGRRPVLTVQVAGSHGHTHGAVLALG